MIEKKQEIKEWIKAILLGTIVCGVVFAFVRPAKIQQTSMLPNFKDGEYVLYSPWANFDRKDVIIFETKNGENYIKRIIGLPGDKIEIKNNEVYVNGEKQDQSYTKEGKTDGFLKCTVPDEHYFVLGDNRLNSIDSRSDEVGTVKKSKIKGEVLCKLFSK